jgi:4-amino-4-deoxy-L-arabinose transferase-like glycosyltransferase
MSAELVDSAPVKSTPASRSRLRWEFAALFVLLAVGAWLRLYHLDQYPLGVHHDELSNMYDGWSIAETGADRFGARYPIVERNYGENDYRPAMYSWLDALTIKLSGFSINAGRLPAAILGIASLILIYSFAMTAGGGPFALLALVLAVLSPLHIQYSRIAHEGAMLPAFFVILILWLWQRAAIRKFPILRSVFLGLVVGLSANAYQATKLTAFLFAVVIGVHVLMRARIKGAALLAFAIGAFLGALPQLIVLASQTHQFFARAKILSVQADNPVSYAAAVLWNFWLNLEPRYLFIPRGYSDLSVARLLPPEILFFYAGLVGLAFVSLRRGAETKWQVYLALVISMLPAALTTGNPNTLRSSGMAVLTPLISAAGILWIARSFARRPSLQRIYYGTVVAVLVISAGTIIYRYSRSILFREAYYQNFLVHLDTALGKKQRDYDAVIIENYGSQRYMYVASFTGMHPREFQRAKKVILSEGMDRFRQLGKYYFAWPSTMQRTADALSANSARILFVSRVPLRGLHPIDSVSWQQEKAYFLVRDGTQ